MWTHRHPYRKSEFTDQYIEYRGRIALYRALNLKRVIAFVGSGITAAYGRPSWSELVAAALAVFWDNETNSEGKGRKNRWREHGNAARVLYEQMAKSEAELRSDPESLVLQLGMAENLARELGKETELREAIAKRLASGRREARQQMEKKLNFGLPQGVWKCRAEPLRALLGELEIDRFLTLNYDLEIERELREHFRTLDPRRPIKPPGSDLLNPAKKGDGSINGESDFGRLCQISGSADDDDFVIPRFPKRVDHIDGTGRIVASVTLENDNIGELVNFALHPRQFQAQVFHLHGRFDRPEGMVLTEADYQRTYLQGGETQHTFEEALSSVFDGNDVLFVGVGMRESDMVRPLRQFVSQDRSPDISKRHVYLLYARRCNIPRSWLEGRGEDGIEKARSARHKSDLKQDRNWSLQMFTQYQLYTIFFGDPSERPLLELPALIDATLPAENQPYPSNNINASRLRQYLNFLNQAIRSCPSGYMLSHNESIDLLSMIRSLNVMLSFKQIMKKADIDRWKAFSQAIAAELRSRSLTNALHKLKNKQDHWWDDWQLMPGRRSEHYTQTYPAIGGTERRKIYSRHRPVYLEYQSPKTGGELPIIRRLRNIVLEQLRKDEIERNEGDGCSEDCHLRPRLARVSMPRGGGKGSVFHLLQQENAYGNFIYETIFPEKSSLLKNTQELANYRAGFFAQLSFSMEFSSVISALTIFFQDAIIELLKNNDPIASKLSFLQNWRNFNKNTFRNASDEEIVHTLPVFLRKHFETPAKPQLDNYQSPKHRIDQLRKAMLIFGIFADMHPENCRLFICFSGLDKLCDQNGVAYNPMYRAFFRLLSNIGCKFEGESPERCPFDLLVIADSSSWPIRYLSKQITPSGSSLCGVAPDDNENLWVRSNGPFLKKWPQLGPLGFDDRYWFETTMRGRRSLAGIELRNYLRGKANESSRDVLPGERSTGNNADHGVAEGMATYIGQPLLTTEQQATPQEPQPTLRTIRNILRQNVAISSWVLGRLEMECEISDDAPQKVIHDRMKELERIAVRAGPTGVLDWVLHLDFYQHEKRARLFEDRVLHNLDGAIKCHIKPLGDQELTDLEKCFIDLCKLVLMNVALFSLPITVRVLYGCDEVYNQTKSIVFKIENLSERQTLGKSGLRRRIALSILHIALHYLVDLRLIIVVSPKGKAEKTVEFGVDEKALLYQRTHLRFTMQNRLREHLTYRMGIPAADRGVRNYYQLSIYCDQPKDLPTPGARHYRMIRRLVERQIAQTTKTLWCLYMFRGAWDNKPEVWQQALGRRDPGELVLAAQGLARRLTKHDNSHDPDVPSIHAISDRIRATYSLLRDGFSVGTISRLPGFSDNDEPDEPFERFAGWLRGITNAAVAMSFLEKEIKIATSGCPMPELKDMWDSTQDHRAGMSNDHPQKSESFADQRINNISKLPPFGSMARPGAVKFRHPFYRDEIGWLLNERALITLVQGKLYDAIPLFERAIFEMQHATERRHDDPSMHASVRRASLNLAIAQIDRGNLKRARNILTGLRVSPAGNSGPPSHVTWLADGYLALIRHITGDLEHAMSDYETVIENANSTDMLRVVSIFNRHLGDLHRRMRDYSAARYRIELATAAAQQSEQRDVLWSARLAAVRIEIADPGTPIQRDPHDFINGCLRYSMSMGLPRLESEALRIQAEVMLAQGDRILAGRIAASAAAIARRNGLRMLKLSALAVYGEALIQRRQYPLARDVLREARREAEQREYQNQAGRISELLEQIPQSLRTPASVQDPL